MKLYRSLQGKLLLPVILFLGVLFSIARLYDLYLNYNSYEQNLIERVTVFSKGVAFNLSAAMAFDDRISADETLSAFNADSDVDVAQLSDVDGLVFAQYEKEERHINDAMIHEHSLRQQAGTIADSHHIHVFVPVTSGDEVLGRLHVIAAKSYIGKLNRKAINKGLFELVMLVICGFIFYKFIERQIVTPITALNQSIQDHIEERTTVARLKVPSNDELGQLVSAFNTMIYRLGRRDEQVAHTLDRLEHEKYFANEVIQTVQHALIVVSQDGKVILHNQECVSVFKVEQSSVVGQSLFSVIRIWQESTLMELIENGTQIDDRHFQATNAQGEPILVQISSRRLTKPGQVLLAIEDVTEFESAMKQLKLAAGVFENIKDAILVLDEDFNIKTANPAIEKTLGYTVTELIGIPLNNLVSKNTYYDLAKTIRVAVERQGHWHGEVIESHKDGRDLPLLVKVAKIYSEQSNQESEWLVMITDLSETKEMERLSYLAHHDVLTGLANRASLYTALEELQAASEFKPYALLYADLDGFKEVNDQFGHDAGDEVLKVVAKRLQSQVRSEDLVVRLAGDEFIIVLRSCLREQLAKRAEKLIEHVSEPVSYKGSTLQVGVSIGGYWSNSCQVTSNEVMKLADTAMYQAKSAGKGCFTIIDTPKDID
ncbi:diguanylate cyclase domain-containing protein [Vibrio astriarenae]